MKAHTDVKMAHMQYELMFQNDVGCDMCVLVAMFDIAMFPSDREGFFYTETESCEGAMFPKKYYVNFFLLHICMYKSSGTKSKALGECQNEINFE